MLHIILLHFTIRILRHHQNILKMNNTIKLYKYNNYYDRTNFSLFFLITYNYIFPIKTTIWVKINHIHMSNFYKIQKMINT